MAAPLDRFGILAKMVRISNSTVDVERRLQNMMELFHREMQVGRAILFNLDRESGRLIARAWNDILPPPDFSVGLEENVLGRAVLTWEAQLAEIDQAGHFPEPLAELIATYQHITAVPVKDDKTLYAVLALLDDTVVEYNSDRLDLVNSIAQEMAGTIRNSRLYAESKKRIAELSVLYEVGRAVSSSIEVDSVLNTVVNITSKVLLAEGCSLNVLDVSRGVLRVSAEYGNIPKDCRFRHLLDDPRGPRPEMMLRCVGREAPYLGLAGDDPYCPHTNAEDKDKSIICLPLHFKGNFKGTLNVFNKLTAPPGRPREFNREDLELLTTMGAMISASLENALTFQTVDGLARHNEALVKELSCLYEISGAMMTTVKMEELLSIITRAVTMRRGLGYDRVLVLLMDEDEDKLVGAAFREYNEQDTEPQDRSLSDLLRKPASSETLPANLGEISEIILPMTDEGVLVRTAVEKRAFNITSGNGTKMVESALPGGFGRLSFATVPMLAKGKVVGVIAVDKDFTAGVTTAQDVKNLSMLANQAALAIENSRLYEYIEQANLMLSQTRERLIEAEKLAALGEMAAGMAHEIRNPLVSIGGFTRRLLKSFETDAPQRTYVEVIINEVSRLEKTLSEVLDFSRDTLGHLDEHNLNEIIGESLYVLRRDFREGGIEVQTEFEEIPSVLVDERQIKHVFFNLFHNACQAMEHGGTVLIRTYSTKVEDRAFVACDVTDTGPGIPPEVLPNVFNPFFTTKDTGTGLGLSIVHKIISRHHGEIDVVNRVEGGATFTIKLPVAAESGLYLK
jgi:two-component system sensor histidine kinase HydH